MNLYYGIDVASQKHNCCVLDEKERVLYEFSFSNDQAGFSLLLYYLNHPSLPSHAKRNIGLEATGVYGENLTEFLRRNEYEVTTFNPLSVKKQLTATTLRKTKTDKSDARFLAVMLARGNYEPDAPTLYHISELKSLSRKRFSLVKCRSGAKNVAKNLLSKLFPEYCKIFTDTFGTTSMAILEKYPSAKDLAVCRPASLSKLLQASSRGRFGLDKAKEIIAIAKSSIGKYSAADALSLSITLEEIAFYTHQIERIERAIHLIFVEHPSPILSIPGIGEVIGAMIISEIGNIKRFSNHNKLLAFAGLEPSIYQSGKFTPTSGSMVKRGSPYLRWALMWAARLVPRYSSTFEAYLEKKIGEGKHFNVATSHVAKKLIRVIFSLEKNNSFFTE
ncbi:MAG: IS110 family transposase [Clostridia bacterium]|nr:IS110 family transposase [Clostridia bacterium]